MEGAHRGGRSQKDVVVGSKATAAAQRRRAQSGAAAAGMGVGRRWPQLARVRRQRHWHPCRVCAGRLSQAGLAPARPDTRPALLGVRFRGLMLVCTAAGLDNVCGPG